MKPLIPAEPRYIRKSPKFHRSYYGTSKTPELAFTQSSGITGRARAMRQSTSSHFSSHPTITIAEQSTSNVNKITKSFDIISSKKMLPGINHIRLVTHRSNNSNGNSDIEHLQSNLSSVLLPTSKGSYKLKNQAKNIRLYTEKRKPMVIEIKGDTRQQHDEEPALLDPVYEKTGAT